jgi:hypothetical protein
MEKTNISSPNIDEKLEWTSPVIEELGDAKALIKEAKFAGFSDGVTFSGNPIGESG